MKTGSIDELKMAMEFAREAHSGQLRVIGQDTGKDYFDTHVVRVVKASPEFARPAAALHDVLEDCGEECWDTFHLMSHEQISRETRDAVILLTRTEKVPYEEYIFRICEAGGESGRIARAVKLADLTDNLSTNREGGLAKRYLWAIQQVSQVMVAQQET